MTVTPGPAGGTAGTEPDLAARAGVAAAATTAAVGAAAGRPIVEAAALPRPATGAGNAPRATGGGGTLAPALEGAEGRGRETGVAVVVVAGGGGEGGVTAGVPVVIDGRALAESVAGIRAGVLAVTGAGA